MRSLGLTLLLLLTISTASAQTIERALMPGELIAGHAKYEEECANCHQRFDKSAQTRLCMDCHKDIGNDVRNKKRLHGKLTDTTCRTCHTDHKGRNASIAPLDKKKFEHDKTDFRLRGAHKELGNKCESCHQPKKKFREAPATCNECHKKDDHDKGHKGKLGAKCESCHNEVKWKEAKFDHEKTKFSLVGGKHAPVKCRDCHADNTFQQTPTTCVGCHRKDDDGEKGHKGRYGKKCETCHNDKSWKDSIFNHDADTQYALKGKHKQAKCSTCHLPEKGPIFQVKLPTKCVTCHKKDDQDKGHRGGLGEKCESCHNERGWKSSTFDHDETKFPLKDKHKDAKCETCHKGGVAGANAKLKLETQCIACHRKNDEEKGHKGRHGTKCETCHNAKEWKTSFFNHDKETKYLLRGKHRETKCDDCHLPAKGPIYDTKLESQCIACHRKDDKHKGQLGNKCESCHNEEKWTGKPFDHDKSRFPLTGSHGKVECKKCHLTPAFHDAPKTCNGCHEKDDKHRGRFGIKCDSCHYTGTWKSWDFDHRKTGFPLDGAHREVDCHECHRDAAPAATRLKRGCYSCHAADDVHQGGLSTQCEQCHGVESWKKLRRTGQPRATNPGGAK